MWEAWAIGFPGWPGLYFAIKISVNSLYIQKNASKNRFVAVFVNPL